ncbi:ABC-2 type transport system permease protein [Halohasta litchfieldiae]|uniref:ABC-2 type transport system permease protein n=1 Tax=Halohasta litchfieldiae TaxID=1073996 RepID=A0A1H6QVI6_9EURY|nr:ABC transporter permease subunit [Halohasta litchfieldiae]ATW88637.1 ABC-2 type transport system permease protein [Halohasta litchfieldiae]SEI47629.1 ABC-2 type transport system permease protein [Halohasta litchfieldiae]
MSWLVVARKDFEDAIRSRWLIGLTVVFILLVSGVSYLARQTASANAVLQLSGSLFVGTLVPLIALVVAYNAVTGERESGSLKLLLSLPHSRADVVFGKVVGRAAALSTAITVGFILPAVILALGPFTLEIGTYIGYMLLVALLASVFVAIAVGWSAAAPSQRTALGGAIGLYFVFVPFWGAIQLRLGSAIGSLADVLPLSARTIGNAIFLTNPAESFGWLTGRLLAGEFMIGETAGLQLSALSMLLFWLLAAPLVGLLVFQRRDL